MEAAIGVRLLVVGERQANKKEHRCPQNFSGPQEDALQVPILHPPKRLRSHLSMHISQLPPSMRCAMMALTASL